MDFRKLDTKTDAETGAFLQLRHPVLGHLLYSGEGTDEEGAWIDKTKTPKEVGVMCRGIESATVQGRLKKSRKGAMAGGDRDDEALGLVLVCSIVVKFINLQSGGKPLEATQANKEAFFDQSDDLVRQVIDFAKEKGNFFKAA
jgi:hypothetical protein